MNRKGISPIIASVLLLAVTLAVVGIFSGWAPSLAQDITERTENSTIETLNCNEGGVEIQSAFHNSTSNETTLAIRNSGSERLPDMSLVAYDANNQVISQKTGLDYSSGEINETILTEVKKDPAYLEIYSTECSSVTARIDDINQ